jgi:hypothetical protein
MPLIQGNHSGRSAVTTVTIIDVAKYIEHKVSKSLVLKGTRPFLALIDTGATSTMIAPRVVAALGLEQVNRIRVAGLGGVSSRPAYLFHVAFYERPPVGPDDISRIHICTKEINGGELTDEHTFDVLLGMDVLGTGDLHFRKDGSWTFSF